MRTVSRFSGLLMLLPMFLAAQNWEVGGSGGYGLYKNVNVTAASVSGSAGFASGFALGALCGNQINEWAGGEVRYTYRADEMQVSSGSTKARAAASSHAIHYDLLVHATPRDAAVRPFLAVGAGMKFYRGTGEEPAYQPLSNLVVLTRTSQAKPLVSVGGGVKLRASRSALVRLDFRDYATPIPSNLLATSPDRKIGGWMHDFVILVGVSKVF
jgi:Outer membrane protein beta-barrel domain